jgi:hypothetical protein
MKKWAKKLSKIGVKGREKDRSRPLKDEKDISNFGRPLEDILKKGRRNTTEAIWRFCFECQLLENL